MRLRLQSSSPLQLAHLAPAFAMTVTASHGTIVVRRDGFARVLTAGMGCTVEAFQPVTLLVAGSLAQPAACSVALHATREMDEGCDGYEGYDRRAALHQQLSRRIFLQPQQPWSAAHTASLLGDTPARVRRTLFAEGAALGELCRTQRLMRLLFEAPHGHLPLTTLKHAIGWPASHDLESAFHDRFGTALHRFRCGASADATRLPLPPATPSTRHVAAPRPHHYWPSLFAA